MKSQNYLKADFTKNIINFLIVKVILYLSVLWTCH